MSNILDVLKPDLQAAPFDAICDLWEMVELAQGDDGKAWLGRNDRFYLLTRLLHRLDAVHPWIYARCREVEAATDGYLDLWAREHYKAIDLDEPVLTTAGWKRHGDLNVGDFVFHPSGTPVKVLAKTEVFTDAPCKRITFTSGDSVVCSGNHLWRILTKSRHRVAGSTSRRIDYTASVVEASSLPLGADVGVASAIHYPEADLPVPPYTLGAWLGDGTSSAARLTCAYADSELIDHVRSDGIAVVEGVSSNKNSGIYSLDAGIRGKKGTGLTSKLRELGVINAKRIPHAYMTASVQQRTALLQGLMDTDGACDTRGKATFCNKSESLANDVFELANSLGLRSRKKGYDTKLPDGRPYRYFQVCFQAYKADAPFKLSRKLERCKTTPREETRSRLVASVEDVPTIPVSCIQVDSPDGLYLVGKTLIPTHNSTVITFAGIIQEIIKDPEITIGIFSHTKPVARKFMLQIKQELESNTELQSVYPEIFFADPRNQAAKWSEEKGLCVNRKSNPKEATVEAHGLVDGQPTGAHFLLRVYDDVVTRESVSTPEQVKKTTEAWELSDNLGARGENGDLRSWHVGTRYSFADTYADIIEKNALKVRLYPATDNGLPNGNPVFLTPEAWADKKLKQGPATIACQQLMNPAAGNEAMFRKDWLSFIDIRPATLNVYIMVDPAHSKKKGSDNTAMAVIGMDSGGNKYLLDGYRHKMGLRERWMAMAGLRKVWMAQPGVQMVKVGYERYGMQADLEYFEEQMLATKDAFEINELNWVSEGGQSKDDRVQRLQPDFQARKFFLAAVTEGETKNQARAKEQGQGFRVFNPVKRRDHDGNVYSLNKGFLEEYLTYPFSAKKDLIDACSRLYDMDPVPPIIIDERTLEPETFADGA